MTCLYTYMFPNNPNWFHIVYELMLVDQFLGDKPVCQKFTIEISQLLIPYPNHFISDSILMRNSPVWSVYSSTGFRKIIQISYIQTLNLHLLRQ